MQQLYQWRRKYPNYENWSRKPLEILHQNSIGNDSVFGIDAPQLAKRTCMINGFINFLKARKQLLMEAIENESG